MLSSKLFSVYTNDSTLRDPSVNGLKFIDDTMVISVINDSRQEDEQLVWSEQPGAESAPDHGDNRGLQKDDLYQNSVY